MDTKIMFKLMIAANELEFQELSEILKNHLIKSKASWLRIYFHFSLLFNLMNSAFVSILF